MEKYMVEGGRPLQGEVTVSGAKNAAVAILPAAVMSGGICTIENIPNISDITTTLRIMQALGVGVRLLDKTTVEIDARHIQQPIVPYELAKCMRGSYYFLGALLGRCGWASVSMPGGCFFGVRPIDQHMKGFEALGAEVSIDAGMINASSKLLLGSHIYFDTVSVGATINVMMAAVRAKGLTVMENCAKEPHVVDVANFLNSMGAEIMGAGTDVIKIKGVDILHGTEYTVIPDQIEAGTFMAAVAAAGGSVLVKNVIPKHLESITSRLERAGVLVEEFDDAVRVSRSGKLQKVNIKTMPHPGFPTDMQPQMTAVLCLAEGTSIITEGVWDNRFRYVDELRRMGAQVQVDGNVAVVEGVSGLTGAPVCAYDLRAGAAMIIAALSANGTTSIEDIHHIERGYDDLVGKLRLLGANISRITKPDTPFEQAL